ncbi:MAG: tyrosine-type recombinase/integrase [Silicimonas sp.]|nr:tyrosine-type recombinase/integrase [Silicimonas sp.]
MLTKIGKTWWIRRRVPLIYKQVESRSEVKMSLKTDSEAVAREKAAKIWADTVVGWEAKMEGDTKLAEHLHRRARQTAQRLGFEYLRPQDIAELPLGEIVTRAAVARRGEAEEDAALGMAEPPAITVSKALELFWEVSRDKISNKTEDQVRRWKNPRKRSAARFIEAVGDKDVGKITRDDMLAFRDHLIDRVEDPETKFTAASANKDLLNFCSTLRTVERRKSFGWTLPFNDLALHEGKKVKRMPFSREWIETKLLADGALDGMNWEARCILKIMINTGARPSEIAGLKRKHVDVKGEIPMITIEPDGRDIKNEHSDRRVPLHGVSLDAAADALDRSLSKMDEPLFPTYFGRDKISDTVNKFLRTNGLRESADTPLYSLRHSFEDRMAEVGVVERVAKDLMGHALQRERYGTGGGDATRYEAVKQVAI